jgi:hypothetical protein
VAGWGRNPEEKFPIMAGILGGNGGAAGGRTGLIKHFRAPDKRNMAEFQLALNFPATIFAQRRRN